MAGEGTQGRTLMGTATQDQGGRLCRGKLCADARDRAPYGGGVTYCVETGAFERRERAAFGCGVGPAAGAPGVVEIGWITIVGIV